MSRFVVTRPQRPLYLAGILLGLASCKSQSPSEADGSPTTPSVPAMSDRGDLSQIKARGTLRVIVPRGGETFLPRAGLPASAERALAAQFATRLGVTAELVWVEQHPDLLGALLRGEGDLVAAQLTNTPSRRQKVAFTRPMATVSEWVVGGRSAMAPNGEAWTLEQLRGQEVHVRPSSSFAETLRQLNDEASLGVVIVPVNERLDTESIVYEVGEGLRPLTVVDSNLLEAIEAYNDRIQRRVSIARGRSLAWAVRPDNPDLLAAANRFLIEHKLTGHTREQFVGDLDQIEARGAIRVLTRNNPVTYFLYRGTPMGFDFELAEMAAKKLGVRLEMVVPPRRDLLIPWLREGRGDVVAASLTVTPSRAEQIAFSAPYLFVDEMLVQRRHGPARVATLSELAGKTIHVRQSSSYYQTLIRLRKTVGPFTIVTVPEEMETEQLVAQVADGTIDFTVADSHLLRAELAYRDGVEAPFALPAASSGPPVADPANQGGSGRKAIAFGVRQNCPKLKVFLDDFVKQIYRGLEYNVARQRYFENAKRIRAAKEQRVGKSGVLSPFDDLLRKYARQYGLDWRLMAAQAYQESRFDPQAVSWAGAQGLFQVMPATAQELGVADPMQPEAGIAAGIQYMHQLVGRFESTLPFRQRVRFALASYNVGYGHVFDARRLAASLGLDPDRWFLHTEKAMRLLAQPRYYRHARYGYCRGSEPVRYVSEIQLRYDNFVRLVPN